MSQQKEEIGDRNGTAEQSHEYSIINNPKYSKLERMALVKSMTDRLQLTLDDIKNSVNQERLNSLSIVPPDLLPFEINLVDGQKVTLMETNPVVTCFDGELTNPEGNVIHVYLRNEGEELPEDFIPPRKMFTVTAQTLETFLPSIIQEALVPKTQESKFLTDPGTSKKLNTPSDATNEELLSCTSIKKRNTDENNKDELVPIVSEEITKYSYKNTSDDTAPSIIGHNVEVEVFTQPEAEENIAHEEHEELSSEKICLKQNDSIEENDASPFSSKIQVLGVIDTGIIRDSGSEEGLNNIVDDYDSKEWIQRENIATIIVDKELSNPSDFRSVFLKTPSPVPKKKSVDVRKSARTRKPKIRSPYKSWDDLKNNPSDFRSVFLKTPSPVPKKKSVDVRKSARTRKPKIRSPFKSWDDLKIRLPKHSRKGRASKGNQVINQKKRAKKAVKKLTHKNKNVISRN